MAEDGPTAIELAQNNDIDVAVLDIRMAGMSGIEVLERLINKDDYDKKVKEIMESL
jgi:CheY-like chemotaxis protein